MPVYSIVIYLHVLSAFLFIFMHGVSGFVAFQVKRETDAERMRALLGVSSSTYGLMYGSLLGILLTGILGGIMGAHWGSGWIWIALAVLVSITVAMSLMGMRQTNPLRKALGMPYFENNRQQKPQSPAEPAVIAERVRALHPEQFASLGVVGLAVILWLMLFKPF